MTKEESAQLDSIERQIRELAAKVETYHVENREQIVSCKACRTTVEGMGKIVWGNGEPGLKGDVQSLKETRGRIKWAIGLMTGAMATIAGALFKDWMSR